MPFLFNRVIIVGVGLIGSSMGMNFLQKRLAHEVIGVGRNKKNLKEAVRRKAITHSVGVPCIETLLGDLTKDDLVILATPVEGIVRYLEKAKSKALFTDVGSTKTSMIAAAKKSGVRFIGSHPIAGTERTGAAAGDINLFKGRLCLVTPLSHSADVLKIKKLWKALGSQVILMDAKKHDHLLSVVSHLPHVAAYGLMQAVGQLISLPHESRFAFGGLKDTTRIAASSPEIWRDIFISNSKNVVHGIDQFLKELIKIKAYLVKKDSKGLFEYLKKSQRLRLMMRS